MQKKLRMRSLLLSLVGKVNKQLGERIAAIAAKLNGTVEDRFLAADSVRIRGPLELRNIVLDEIAINGLSGIGPILISRCRIGTLRLSDLTVREGITIEDCEIGNLEVREARKSTFSIIRSDIRRSVLHACNAIVIDSTNVTELLTLSDVVQRIDIARSRAGSLSIIADGPSNLSDATISATHVRERLDVQGLDGGDFCLSDVSATRVHLTRVRMEKMQLRGLSVEQQLLLQAVRGHHGPADVEIGGDVGSATVSVADERGASITFRNVIVREDLVLEGVGEVYLDEGCTVGGFLRGSDSFRSISIQVAPGANIRAIQAPAATIRSPKEARQVALCMLGGSTVTELSILRDSLGARPDEQDIAYFALRRAEENALSGLRRATMWLRRQMFGWGVTFIHPLRTLSAAVLTTGVAVFVCNPSGSEGGAERIVDASVTALGLWFNVGTGMPAGLDERGWAVAAVACTALGVVFITVLIGVGIRRLTR